jgi:hypothetical protein
MFFRVVLSLGVLCWTADADLCMLKAEGMAQMHVSDGDPQRGSLSLVCGI